MNMSPVSAHSDFAADQPFPDPFTRSVFPADAQATIYKTAPSPMTSGRPRAERWTFRFQRRSAPYIEPLMGWTGDDDTLAQVGAFVPVRRNRHRICAPAGPAVDRARLARAGV